MESKTDERWAWAGISGEMIREKATWIAEERSLHGRSRLFFDTAGRILVHAEQDYLLITPVFFHGIIGVESALKLHYGEEDGHLKEMLQRGVKSGLINDTIFSDIRPLSKEMTKSYDGKSQTHSAKLAELIPFWRNQYFHGGFLLDPDYFYLSVQLREIADALTTQKYR